MRGKYVSCQECVNLLFDYLDSSLDPDMMKQLDEHFAACPPCINFLKTYQACQSMERKMSDQEVNIPMEMEERLKNFLHEQLRG